MKPSKLLTLTYKRKALSREAQVLWLKMSEAEQDLADEVLNVMEVTHTKWADLKPHWDWVARVNEVCPGWTEGFEGAVDPEDLLFAAYHAELDVGILIYVLPFLPKEPGISPVPDQEKMRSRASQETKTPFIYLHALDTEKHQHEAKNHVEAFLSSVREVT